MPPPRPPPPPNDDEMEQPVNAPCPVELKAGLPNDFLGNAEDAARWLVAISAYFAMNATIYSDDTKILTTLNKMSKGRGSSFLKVGTINLLTTPSPMPKKRGRPSRRISRRRSAPLISRPVLVIG
jgi:hypothetical protein